MPSTSIPLTAFHTRRIRISVAVIFGLSLITAHFLPPIFSSFFQSQTTILWIEILLIALGGSLYPDPATSATGTIYGPIFFYVSGFLDRCIPGNLFSGRLISLASTLVSCFFVYKTAVLIHKNRITAFWGMCLFLSTYAIAGKFYDLIAVDPLLMCLCTAALYFLLKNTPGGDFRALVFMCIASFTKQTAVLPLVTVIVFMIVSRRKLWTWTPLLASIIFGTGLLIVTNRFAWTYLVTLPSSHTFRGFIERPELIRLFILQLPLWIGFWFYVFRTKNLRFCAFSFTLLIIGIMGLLKGGGWINAFFPFQPVLCIGASAALSRWKPLLVIQLILGLYNPTGALYPLQTIRDTDRKAVETARSVDGPVWFPSESYLWKRAGKQEWDHYAALDNLTWAGLDIPRRIILAVENRHFDLIIMRKDKHTSFMRLDRKLSQLIRRNYIYSRDGGLVIYRPGAIHHKERFLQEKM
ncbi:MAG: hypothetical protein GF401_03880 [Chitinivibrionales bacterium]|nr:hypothetical protein [Chitinivibrionales bacterium]